MGDEPPPPLTNSQVKKAGHHLRRALASQPLESLSADAESSWAWGLLDAFRSDHVEPMLTMLGHLTEVGGGSSSHVSSRVKRTERILQKIVRTKTSLSSLQDIAGVRIVVPELDDQLRAVDSLRSRGLDEVKFYDYVSSPEKQLFDGVSGSPRQSGYRAVHVVHRVVGRLVETQIRTAAQHRWATAVERAEQLTGQPLKVGEGAQPVLAYFHHLSRMLAMAELGDGAPGAMLAESQLLWVQAMPYYPSHRNAE